MVEFPNGSSGRGHHKAIRIGIATSTALSSWYIDVMSLSCCPMSSKLGLQVYLKWLLHSEEPRDRAVSAKPEGTSGSCGVCYWEVYESTSPHLELGA